MDSDDVARRINGELLWEPKVDNRDRAVSANDGVVTVSDTVGSLRKKRNSIEKAHERNGRGVPTTPGPGPGGHATTPSRVSAHLGFAIGDEAESAPRGSDSFRYPKQQRSTDMPTPTRRLRPYARVVMAGAAGIGLCACAASTPTASPSTTTTTTPVVVVPNVQAGVSPAAGTGDLRTLQRAFLDVVAKVRPAVVEVATNRDIGSGIIYDTRGDIVTNSHVVGSATSFQVSTVTGKTVPATLVGTYPQGDIAVVRAMEPLNLPPARFGDSALLAPGSIVFAVGSPLGLSSSVTQGIVSYNGRPASEGNGVNLSSTIQTSAAINPGNSGGALVDLDGDIVGIPTLAAINVENGGQAGGIGFAIPSNSVRPLADQLIASGRVTNTGAAALAIAGSDAVDASGNPIGVVVGTVPSPSGVDEAGIVRGDIVTSVAGHATPTLAELENVVAGLHSGATVSVGIISTDGHDQTVNVVLDQLGD